VARKYNIAEMTGSRGIAQLRWATFGEPSQVNAQPHLDSDGDMVGAHNGNVVNNFQLRHQYISEGLTIRSQNDGETCVHAVERTINKGYEFPDTIRLPYSANGAKPPNTPILLACSSDSRRALEYTHFKVPLPKYGGYQRQG